MSLVETLNDLAVQPDLGRVRKFRNRRLAGLRSFQIQGSFHKHLIFYRIEDDTLVLFRVLQGMRDLPRRLLEPPGSE
jgi:plasmid stabilization system protein ParE